MLNKLEFKLKLEEQFKQGREKMASMLVNSTAKDDKREKGKLMADQKESDAKMKLLRQAAKKYGNLLCDEDEVDEGQSPRAFSGSTKGRWVLNSSTFTCRRLGAGRQGCLQPQACLWKTLPHAQGRSGSRACSPSVKRHLLSVETVQRDDGRVQGPRRRQGVLALLAHGPVDAGLCARDGQGG
jgi:hypothetical protein